MQPDKPPFPTYQLGEPCQHSSLSERRSPDLQSGSDEHHEVTVLTHLPCPGPCAIRSRHAVTSAFGRSGKFLLWCQMQGHLAGAWEGGLGGVSWKGLRRSQSLAQGASPESCPLSPKCFLLDSYMQLLGFLL